MPGRHDHTSPIVYLDLDGVLADFVGAALRLFGASCDATAVTSWDGIPAAINAHRPSELTVAGPVDAKVLWSTVAAQGASLWAELEPLPWAGELVGTVERFVPRENIHLVTTPQPDPASWAGKAEWVRRHMPEYSSRLRMCTDKSHLVRPDQVRVLVDDGQHNTDAWARAGGTAHLWPMPWSGPADVSAYIQPNIALSRLDAAIKRAVNTVHDMREMRIL